MNSRWQVNKEAFGILRIQLIFLCIFRGFELFVDVVFKYATLPTGTIRHYATGADEYFV